MIGNKKVLAYIPARSGSKGISDKNIKDVGGIPLIAHTILAAKKSRYVDKIVVSTDSEKYAEISEQFGAEVPFIRPAELAQDETDETDVILHLLNWLKNNNQDKFDLIIKLQPTSPLRTSEDIDKAIEIMLEKSADSIISVSEAVMSPLWMNILPEDGSMKDFIKMENTPNRQQLKKYYQLNGAIFISTPEAIVENQGWFGDNSFAYIMPRERSVDVDEPIDLKFVEFLMGKKNESRR